MNELNNKQPNIYKEKKLGFLIIIIFIGGFLLWASLATIESASIAQGKITVFGEDNIVEHLEGGLVKHIYVEEGDTVKAGQVLITLDKTQAAVEADIDSQDKIEMMIMEARLLAELNNQSIVNYPKEVLERKNQPEIQKLIATQDSTFKADNESFISNISIYQQRMDQVQSQIEGANAQLEATKKQLFFINKELKDMRALAEERLIKQSELLALEREGAGLTGQQGQQISQIAALKESLGETQLQINAEWDKRRKDILTDLRDVQAKLTEAKEKNKAAQDRLQRTEIKAPVSGVIVNLKVNTVGEVIKPGEVLMEIVPKGEKLIAMVKVNPLDIDVVHKGLTAKVRLSPYKPRTTPMLLGVVTNVSANVLKDEVTQKTYYDATVVINPDQLRKLKNVELYPGMPVEVMIITNKLSPLAYFFAPIKRSFSRSFRED